MNNGLHSSKKTVQFIIAPFREWIIIIMFLMKGAENKVVMGYYIIVMMINIQVVK